MMNIVVNTTQNSQQILEEVQDSVTDVQTSTRKSPQRDTAQSVGKESSASRTSSIYQGEITSGLALLAVTKKMLMSRLEKQITLMLQRGTTILYKDN